MENVSFNDVMAVLSAISVIIVIILNAKNLSGGNRKEREQEKVTLENRLTKIESLLNQINDAIVKNDLVGKVNDLEYRIDTIEKRGCGNCACLDNKNKERNLKIMNTVTAIISILVFALLVQFITEVIKKWLPEKYKKGVVPLLVAALFGVVIAILFSVDIFALLGFTAGYGTVGAIAAQIVTGLILSAGAQAVHELINSLQNPKTE